MRVLQVHAVGVEPRDRVDCAVDVAGCHSSGVDLHMVGAEGSSGEPDSADDLAGRHRLSDAY